MEARGRRRGNSALIKLLVSDSLLPDSFENPLAEAEERVTALIDTGASVSLLDARVVRSLNLRRYGEVRLLFPDRTELVIRPTYLCGLSFARSYAADSFIEWPDLWEVAPFEPDARGFNAVLGMDVLTKGDLSLVRTGAVTFDFNPFP